MNAQDSRLTCERCHGIGYVNRTLPLGGQPTDAQGVQFRGRHQNQVYILNAHKKRPRHRSGFTVAADRHIASVDLLPVFKNLESSNPVFARVRISTRSNRVAVQGYFSIEKHIFTDRSARDTDASFVISTSSTQLQKNRNQDQSEVVSNHQEMSGEQG